MIQYDFIIRNFATILLMHLLTHHRFSRIPALLFISLWASLSSVQSQSIQPQVIAGGGEHYMGSAAQLSQTFGETIIQTATGSAAILTQGFHQPDAGSVGIEKWKEEGWGLGIYPNPTAGRFTVQLNAVHEMNMTIHNSVGQVVLNQKLSKGQNYLDLSYYASGMYLLTVYDDSGKYYGTYKLQVL